MIDQRYRDYLRAVARRTHGLPGEETELEPTPERSLMRVIGFIKGRNTGRSMVWKLTPKGWQAAAEGKPRRALAEAGKEASDGGR